MVFSCCCCCLRSRVQIIIITFSIETYNYIFIIICCYSRHFCRVHKSENKADKPEKCLQHTLTRVCTRQRIASLQKSATVPCRTLLSLVQSSALGKMALYAILSSRRIRLRGWRPLVSVGTRTPLMVSHQQKDGGGAREKGKHGVGPQRRRRRRRGTSLTIAKYCNLEEEDRELEADPHTRNKVDDD